VVPGHQCLELNKPRKKLVVRESTSHKESDNHVVVRCSAIESILHRYHRCGPIFMLEDKDNYRGSSLRMAFRIFRCHRAFKTNKGSLDTSFGDLKPT
jgi:hypothetical protein